MVLLSENINGPLSNPDVLLFLVWIIRAASKLFARGLMIVSFCDTIFMYDHTYYPNRHRTFIQLSFRAYLHYVIYEGLHNVVIAFINERCFTYV